jgi:hypothetical protein
MSVEDNKAIVGRWFAEFWGRNTTRMSSMSSRRRTSGSSTRCTRRAGAGTRCARSRPDSAPRSPIWALRERPI